MNHETPESPKHHLRRPISGWLWLAAICAVLFGLVYVSPIAPDRSGERLAFAAVVAVCGGLLATFLRWLCCWRNLRRFLFGVVCAATLIALSYAVEDWRGRRAWETHQRQLQAKWGNVTLASLVPPPVPDDQNFAMTPLLKSALTFSRVEGRLVWQDTNAQARLQNLRAELQLSGRRTNDHLVLGSLDRGTFADLQACREFYRGNTNYPQPAVSGTAAEDILVALGKFDAALRELREAATRRPAARFAVVYDEEPSWGILLPHLAPLKGLAILMHIHAVAELEAGHSENALADMRVGFRVSDAIRDEPIFISHLVRIASLTITLPALREGLARHAWSDAQLGELEKYLASLDLLAEYKLAMRGERGFGMAGLDYLRRQGFKGDSLQYLDGNDTGLGSTLQLVRWAPGGWLYQNMRTISQMHEDFTLAAVDEKSHRIFTEPCEKLDAHVEALAYRPYTVFAKMLLPAVFKVVLKSARTQVWVDCARVACALERHRLANGELPENLAALVPRFIGRIPTDVIDGKPLRYSRKTDGSYLLYSVGWNKSDDGGEIAWTKGKEPVPATDQGDWVWQMPAKLPVK